MYLRDTETGLVCLDSARCKLQVQPTVFSGPGCDTAAVLQTPHLRGNIVPFCFFSSFTLRETKHLRGEVTVWCHSSADLKLKVELMYELWLLYYLRRKTILLLEFTKSLGNVIGAWNYHSRANHSADRTGRKFH